jgi:hypothetical protein
MSDFELLVIILASIWAGFLYGYAIGRYVESKKR